MALKNQLIDTGPLVAYLDRKDTEHNSVADIIEQAKVARATFEALHGGVAHHGGKMVKA